MVKFACRAALLPYFLWTAHAQTVLFGNLSATVSAYETVNTNTPVIGNSGPLFDSFSTGPSPLILSDVRVSLKLAGEATGSLTVVLYPATLGYFPGTQLMMVGTLNDSSISPGGAVYDFPVTPGFALTSNARYLIGITSSNSSAAVWAKTTSLAGSGIAGEYSCDYETFPGGMGQVCDPNSSHLIGPFLMEVTANSPAPPPSVPDLSLTGMAVLLMLLAASAVMLLRPHCTDRTC